jgi:hypothetical protein
VENLASRRQEINQKTVTVIYCTSDILKTVNMRRFLDDDSIIDSGNELRLTTVAGAEECHQRPSASKVDFSVCT